jgi:hypothetical protein
MNDIQFRSPDESEIHVSTTMGHAARIGPEWRALPPILHKAAIAAGAITNNMTAAAIVAKQESASPAFEEAEVVKKAIAVMLDEDDTANFTAAGMPNLNKLSARCGFSVDRELMQSVWAEMQKAAE